MTEKTPTLSNKPIRVLLVARYPLVQEGLKLFIGSNHGLTVTGTLSFTDNVGKSAKVPDSDVALICISSGDRVGIISDLLHRIPRLRVVALVAGCNLDTQAEALRLGAVGIVQKEQNPKLLIDAIRQTYDGETWLNQVLLSKLLEKGKQGAKKAPKFSYELDIETLTARELQVINMIGEGLKNKNIAERLFISEATVRHHLSSIYGKVGVEDRLNLVIFAYQRGLIKLAELEGKSE